MQEMIFDRSLIKDNVNDKEFIFSPNTHLCELYIASRVKMLLGFAAEQIKNIDTEIEKCEKNDGIEYAALQKEAITQALTKGMLVLTGGPGTGKTTTLNAIIKPCFLGPYPTSPIVYPLAIILSLLIVKLSISILLDLLKFLNVNISKLLLIT